MPTVWHKSPAQAQAAILGFGAEQEAAQLGSQVSHQTWCADLLLDVLRQCLACTQHINLQNLAIVSVLCAGNQLCNVPEQMCSKQGEGLVCFPSFRLCPRIADWMLAGTHVACRTAGGAALTALCRSRRTTL